MLGVDLLTAKGASPVNMVDGMGWAGMGLTGCVVERGAWVTASRHASECVVCGVEHVQRACAIFQTNCVDDIEFAGVFGQGSYNHRIGYEVWTA